MNIKDMIKANKWHPHEELREAGKLVQKALNDPEWNWTKNSDCKYITIRIDMRNGGFVVLDRNNNRIDPATITNQG